MAKPQSQMDTPQSQMDRPQSRMDMPQSQMDMPQPLEADEPPRVEPQKEPQPPEDLYEQGIPNYPSTYLPLCLAQKNTLLNYTEPKKTHARFLANVKV